MHTMNLLRVKALGKKKIASNCFYPEAEVLLRKIRIIITTSKKSFSKL